MSKDQLGHKNRNHVRAEEKWFSRENIWTTFPLNNGCKNRPTLSLNERKKIKKKCSRQNIWTTFPLNINWGICLSKNKKKKKKKKLRHCLVFFFLSLNFRYSLLITHHSKIPYLFGTITHFSSLNIFHTICVVTLCSFFFSTQTHRT